MFRSLIDKLHIWLAQRDFVSSHKHFVSSGAKITTIMQAEDGTSLSIYTSDKKHIYMLIDKAKTIQEELDNG